MNKVILLLLFLTLGLIVLIPVQLLTRKKDKKYLFVTNPNDCQNLLSYFTNTNAYNMGDKNRLSNLKIPSMPSDFMKDCNKATITQFFNTFCTIPTYAKTAGSSEIDTSCFALLRKQDSEPAKDITVRSFKADDITTFPLIWNSVTMNEDEDWVKVKTIPSTKVEGSSLSFMGMPIINKGQGDFQVFLGDDGHISVRIVDTGTVKDLDGKTIKTGAPPKDIPISDKRDDLKFFYEGTKKVFSQIVDYTLRGNTIGGLGINICLVDPQQFMPVCDRTIVSKSDLQSPMYRYKIDLSLDYCTSTSTEKDPDPWARVFPDRYPAQTTGFISCDLYKCNSTRILNNFLKNGEVRFCNDGNILASSKTEKFESGTQDGTIVPPYSEQQYKVISFKNGVIPGEAFSDEDGKERLWMTKNGNYFLYFNPNYKVYPSDAQPTPRFEIYRNVFNMLSYLVLSNPSKDFNATPTELFVDEFNRFAKKYKAASTTDPFLFVDPRSICVTDHDKLLEYLFGSIPDSVYTAVKQIAPCLSKRCQSSMDFMTANPSLPRNYMKERCPKNLTLCVANIKNEGELQTGGDFKVTQNCGSGVIPCGKDDKCPLGQVCRNETCQTVCDAKSPCPKGYECKEGGVCISTSPTPPKPQEKTNIWLIIVPVIAVFLFAVFMFFRSRHQLS